MYIVIAILTFSVFAIGVLVGVRCQEFNIRGREQRLAEGQRRVNARIRALQTHHEVSNLIWEARNELRRDALLQANDISFITDREFELLTVPSQRNGVKSHPTQERIN